MKLVYFVISNVIEYDKQNNTLRSLLEKEKLNGIKIPWLVSKIEKSSQTRKKKEYAIEEPFLLNQLLMHLELTKTT